MPLYSVRLLIRCSGKGQPTRVPLYEDRLVLVRARNHNAARTKAKQIADQQSVPYKNVLGNTVHWRVADVYGSVELFEDEFKNGEIKDGAQVYWRYIRSANPVKRLKREGTMNALYQK
jgi:Domain of unknown function (DUF4288)